MYLETLIEANSKLTVATLHGCGKKRKLTADLWQDLVQQARRFHCIQYVTHYTQGLASEKFKKDTRVAITVP